MDDSDSTEESKLDLTDETGEVQATPPGEALEALEGEIVQPRQRPDDAVARADAGPEDIVGEAGDGADKESPQRENVERGLAQYVFVREEREREVRLTFRDASPADIARTFRTAGAHLITLSAERASLHSGAATMPPTVSKESGEESIEIEETFEIDEQAPKRKTGRQRSKEIGMPRGEVLLRYFYALGETVYTVNIVSPTGVADSIVGTYPLAARSERELTGRLAVVFV